MFDNNFGKNVDQLSKLFYQLIHMKILYVYTKQIFTTPAMCYCTTLWKLKIQKCCWFWQHPQQTVDMFLRTLWGLDLVRQTVWRLFTLIGWLTFLSLSDDQSTAEDSVEHCCVTANFFTVIIFAPSSFFLGYTSYVVHTLKYKKLSCRRETARRFVSLNNLLSHSRSFEITLLSRACVSPY